MRRTKRKRVSNSPHASQFVDELALTNKLFRERIQSKGGLFEVDLRSIPELFTRCESRKNFLIKLQSLKKLLTINPEAAEKVIGTSQNTLDNSGLAEKILETVGASIIHVSDMFTDLERMVNSGHFDSAILRLESMIGRQDKELQMLWDATLRLATCVVKECGAALAYERHKN